jgi:hypothetical protein
LEHDTRIFPMGFMKRKILKPQNKHKTVLTLDLYDTKTTTSNAKARLRSFSQHKRTSKSDAIIDLEGLVMKGNVS